jgi:hypothetical protein
MARLREGPQGLLRPFGPIAACGSGYSTPEPLRRGFSE